VVAGTHRWTLVTDSNKGPDDWFTASTPAAWLRAQAKASRQDKVVHMYLDGNWHDKYAVVRPDRVKRERYR
jgi:hypothetical protein